MNATLRKVTHERDDLQVIDTKRDDDLIEKESDAGRPRKAAKALVRARRSRTPETA